MSEYLQERREDRGRVREESGALHCCYYNMLITFLWS